MEKEIEIERRAMVTEDQYNAIRNDYINFPSFKNTNYYFDDPNLTLTNSHQVLRIRTVDDISPIIQYKFSCPQGDIEYHIPIGYMEFKKTLTNGLVIPRELKKDIKLDKVYLICSLKTERVEVKKIDHLLVIDKNEYLNKTDYNIEVEANYKEDAEKAMKEYVEQYKIEIKGKYVSKSRRVISLVRKLK